MPPPSEVNSNNCPLCKGAKWKYVFEGEEQVAVPCECLQRQILLQYLGLEIFKSAPVPSDLYKPVLNPDTGEVDGDRTQDNLFIKGSWPVLCQHLHWVFERKRWHTKNTFNFTIVTDEKLLKVWLGQESYSQRSTKVRNEIDTYNTMADLISDPALVLIRLGFIHRNRAAPDVLKEALGIRHALLRPTWIIEGTERLFGDGHHSYDPDLGSYIEEHFDVVDLGNSEAKDKKLLQELALDFDSIGMGTDVDTPSPAEVEPTQGSAAVSRFFDSGPSEQRRKKSRPGFKPYNKGKRGGGLPEV